MQNKCIAVIPARGGSKRIPKKNIKLFHGKPLIAYSIEVALKSKLFDKVVVSTDDEEIARIAKKYGAEVPFLRPKELSDDFSSSGDVVNHTIQFMQLHLFSKASIYSRDLKSLEKVVMRYPLFLLLLCLFLFKGLLKLQMMEDVKCFGLKISQREVRI